MNTSDQHTSDQSTSSQNISDQNSSDQLVLVTGAGRGLGSHIARA
ncbi:MAG: hypothetical protein JWR01_1596, partial [Subtercola sp.]|nr:hypothetical protein [Subtercola sp.]